MTRPPHPSSEAIPITDSVEIVDSVCPALHIAKTDSGRTVPVCGCHHDRMLLSHKNMKRWCVGDFAKCPHWRQCDRH